MTKKATHNREEVEKLFQPYDLRLRPCFLKCPPNRFNQGEVKIILHDFRWYQFWRLVTVIKAQMFLQSKLSKTVTVDWEAR